MKLRKPKDYEEQGFFGMKERKKLDVTSIKLELPERKLRNVRVSELEVKKNVYQGNIFFLRRVNLF